MRNRQGGSKLDDVAAGAGKYADDVAEAVTDVEKYVDDVIEGGNKTVGNITKNLDTSNIPNMTKKEILDSIPDGLQNY